MAGSSFDSALQKQPRRSIQRLIPAGVQVSIEALAFKPSKDIRMKDEILIYSDHTAPLEAQSRSANTAEKRIDPRCTLVVQALVAIPSMPSRAYGICEVSRSGMFLAFRNARSTNLELEQGNIGPGTDLEIAFTVSQEESRYRVRIRARIVRITSLGIGVQFATRNPPQLAPLRELFPPADAEVAYANQQRDSVQDPRGRQTLLAPPKTTGWQDWELLD